MINQKKVTLLPMCLLCRFLDILHEAPLFGHRKSRSLVGSYLYIVLLASYSILLVKFLGCTHFNVAFDSSVLLH